MSVVATESDLARAFMEAASVGAHPWFLEAGELAAELRCRQGVPDFVGSLPSSRSGLSRGQAEVLCIPSAAHVLSLLKPRARRTEDYLLAATGLSQPVVRSAVRGLVSTGLAQPDGVGYTMAAHSQDLDVKLWAFELKLHNWRRALYQALTYHLFADRVAVVLPTSCVDRLRVHTDRFKQWGVGLACFDTERLELIPLVQPRVGRRRSLFHYYYAAANYALACPDD